MPKSRLNLLKKFYPDLDQLEIGENLEFEVLVFLQKTKTSNPVLNGVIFYFQLLFLGGNRLFNFSKSNNALLSSSE